MKITFKSLSAIIPLMFSLSSGTANAEWVELGTVDSGFSFSRLFITSIGDFYNGLDGQAPILTYELGPGVYQVNYKVLGQELGWSADRVVGTAVGGLGNYRLGFNVGETIVTDLLNAPAVAAVPEPETYAMLLTGLLLIGFSAARRNAAGKRLV
jgi:hypothetical protein